MDIVIRKLKEEDVEQVCALEREAFSLPWNREDFLQMISSPNALYLVADSKENVVGYAGCLCVLDEGDICNVVVNKNMRGLGIGSAIVKELIYRGNREFGIKDFTLEVRESNVVARHVYESQGFVFEGIRPGFYDLPKEDAAIYWLRNVEL